MTENGRKTASPQAADEFVHIVSHDLKEPLRSIQNFSHMLLEDYGGMLDPGGQEYLQVISRCAQRLQKQIDSLARYAYSGQYALAPESIPLDLLVKDTCESLSALIAERKADVRIIGTDAALRGDPSCLVEIMVNLVQNAIRYNDNPVPLVEIGISPPHPGMPECTVFVRDNGIGIKKEHHDIVFNIFKRLHPADRYGGGTGSGLAIARKLVEHCGGRIWVESQEGQGATFFFTVPCQDGAL